VQSGNGSLRRRKPWVACVWPIIDRVKTILLRLHKLAGILSKLTVGRILCSLLLTSSLQRCCHSNQMWLSICGRRSENGRLTRVRWPHVNADLAAMSACSLPVIPMWLGIQQNTILMWWYRAWSVKRTSLTFGWSICLFCMASKQDFESEKMTVSLLSADTCSSASWIACSSAVKIEQLFGSLCRRTTVGKTAAQETPSLPFDPSV